MLKGRFLKNDAYLMARTSAISSSVRRLIMKRCFHEGAGVKIRQNIHSGISPEMTEMSIFSYKVAMCYGSGV